MRPRRRRGRGSGHRGASRHRLAGPSAGAGCASLHEAGNLVAQMEYEKGDVEEALAKADVVIDRVFETPSQEHVCLEPGGGVGVYEDGRFTIYIGAQWPQIHVNEVARAMKVEPGDVRVISTPIGGAFGSKTDGPLAVHLALLAKATGRPVRIVLSREEVMAAGAKRHPFKVHTRMGVSKAGTILALDTDALVDTGPYATVGMVVLKVAGELCTGAYRVKNARFRGRVAYTNNGNAGAFRGYGAPQAHFPLEVALDLAAAELGMDPAEIRRKNVLRVGDEHGMYGHTITHGLMAAETLEAVVAHPWWQERDTWQAEAEWPWRRGVGMALAIKGVGLGSARNDTSAARLALSDDGAMPLRGGPGPRTGGWADRPLDGRGRWNAVHGERSPRGGTSSRRSERATRFLTAPGFAGRVSSGPSGKRGAPWWPRSRRPGGSRCSRWPMPSGRGPVLLKTSGKRFFSTSMRLITWPRCS
ncbi:MAG TPA: molybdopterin cofactor-binding domain-containing protein [Actinomycetota bacterium]|nr:molybdopterin cofactor-binding domain-containing protein [Actinomycetota bacterium]